ncbi:hypothetical protein SETIT_9G336600v2 [Setaria italica]|uniref:Uncharacterized protein n=1 Tax=Setaria italica TaxID=4555 RepID=A0A368SNM7_SETIT|nr:hypothetical protein SETIT_9G336600v2 [Setaria italica]
MATAWGKDEWASTACSLPAEGADAHRPRQQDRTAGWWRDAGTQRPARRPPSGRARRPVPARSCGRAARRPARAKPRRRRAVGGRAPGHWHAARAGRRAAGTTGRAGDHVATP